ncbi:protein FAM104B isoform X4 [Meriones unguiculatus]|uniref:protein FAM104B isoform X4 n=1 Tax=Meriones unguiculatus TaxID=10047 RepID=UPI00293EC5D7|nr:protein FAM104B isoform X4 [Meriones unguiculatus]
MWKRRRDDNEEDNHHPHSSKRSKKGQAFQDPHAIESGFSWLHTFLLAIAFTFPPGSRAQCGDRLRLDPIMDPLQKWDPLLISVPSCMATVTSSQESSAFPQPSSSEKLSVGLSGLSLSPSPSSGVPAPLSQGLLQQQAREKKALWQQYWEKQGFPQRKKVFLRHSRRWHRDHMAPYLLEKDVRGGRSQNQLLCQGHVLNSAGVSGERNAAPNPPSWEMLVQGFSGLTLSLGANRPGPLPEGPLQQQEPEEMCQQKRQQESIRMLK